MRKQPQQHRRSGRIPHNLSVLPADFAWLRTYGGGVASDGLALAVSTLRSAERKAAGKCARCDGTSRSVCTAQDCPQAIPYPFDDIGSDS